MCGQEGFFGTSAFQVVLDIEEMQKLEATASSYTKFHGEQEIEEFFDKEENPMDSCSMNQMTIQNNVVSMKTVDLGGMNDYNPGF
jgi:hypothetical protein